MNIEQLPRGMREVIDALPASPVGNIVTTLVMDAVATANTVEEAKYLIGMTLEGFERAIAIARRDLDQS